LADATAVDRDLTFDNCLFLNMSEDYAVTQSGNFKLTSDLTKGYIVLKDCVSVGASKWDVDDRDKIHLFNSPTPAADTAGIARQV